MLQIFRKKDGAVSVFLTIILVPMIVVSCLFVDACRAKLAEPVVSSAGDLTLNTALTQYDATLNDYYGLMASSQNVDEFLNNANEYFQACITSQGVSASEGKEFADEISGLLTGRSSDITDLLQISETEGSSFTIKPVENGTLENPALMKKEIVEFMKYRAPIDGVSDVLQKFKDSSKDLTDAQKNADLVDKKQKFYEEEGELVKKSKEAYDKLQEYINLNITQESVSEMKSSFESVENDYKNLHIKMVKDLYNTQRLAQYSKSDLYENWKPKENEIQKGQVNSYINNAAKSLVLNKVCKNIAKDRLTTEGKDADAYLKYLGIKAGIEGLDFSRSEFCQQGSNEIKIIVDYKVHMLEFFGIEWEFQFEQCAATKAWIAAGGSSTSEKKTEE